MRKPENLRNGIIFVHYFFYKRNLHLLHCNQLQGSALQGPSRYEQLNMHIQYIVYNPRVRQSYWCGTAIDAAQLGAAKLLVRHSYKCGTARCGTAIGAAQLGGAQL